jgi:hypothetical protein
MQQALLLLHMYASVDESKGMNSRYPSLGNNFIEAAVQFLVEEVPIPEAGCASSFTFVTGRFSPPSQHHAHQARDLVQPHVTKHVTSPNHMSPPALLRPPLPYEVMHAYLPAQEKMAEMVHSPISTLLYFIDHTNLLTVWSALLLECKVRVRPGVLFR